MTDHSSFKILIVEDEAIVAADLAGKLRRLGYEVCGIAAEGEEAVALACSLRPQLVLMDIRLEGRMDGIETAAAICCRHEVPVIYLTAHSDSATLARAKLTGPFGFVLKPFEERDLATQIELAIYKYQAERQVREQREWLRVTLTSIGDAVIATDGEGRVTFLNPVAESLTGWRVEEATGQPVTEVFRVINEQTGHPLEEPVGQVLRAGHTIPLANHAALVTRDGRTVPIEDSAAPILDAAGQVIGVVLVFHDVTEKRRAEEVLRQSRDELELRVRERTAELHETMEALRAERQRFNDVLDVLPVYVALLTPDYQVPFANQVFRQRFGESRGLRCFEHLFGRKEPCEVCETYTVLKTMEPHQWEWAGPDGRHYSVFDFPFPDTDGSTVILEMGIDITERKRAEEQLYQASQYSRSLIEASLDPLVTISPEGKITDANEATIHFTGVTKDELIGSDFSTYFTEPGKAREVYRQVFERGLATDYPLTIRNRDGSLVEVLYNASVYKDAGGNVLGVFAAARDITAIREMERQLAHVDRLASIGLLAGGIAHEIRNPLAAVNLFIDILSDEEKFRRTRQEESILGEIKQNIYRMDGIIRRVLDFSRQSTMVSVRIKVGVLIEQSLDLWKTKMTKSDIKLGLSVAENLPEIIGDPIEIQQVMTNLIQNAVEAMERNGALHIIAEGGALSFDKERPAAIIKVQDSGPGIPLDRQKNLFNPFYTTKHSGTGLGLAISQRIVSRHGGLISFESVPGDGTTFTVELPAVQES